MEATCAVCGKHVHGKKIRRKLNAELYYLCSIDCEVKWEKENMIGSCG
jgi:hypothetical protein